METRHSDNPVFLLLKALITGQKIFYATGDGDVNQKTIVCTDFTSIADQDGNQIHIVDPNSSAHDQTRDIEGDTTSGTITVKTALGCKITENTAFIVTGIRSTPVEVANLEAWIKTALIGNINAVNRAAGKQQIAKTTEDLNQVIGTYDLFTGTTQDVLLESILIRMPNIVAGGAITSISIQTDDATPQVLLSAADGAVANLTAEAQLAWQNFNAPILIKVGTKVQLTIAGGAHGVAYVCDIVAKTRAVTSGGYLA